MNDIQKFKIAISRQIASLGNNIEKGRSVPIGTISVWNNGKKYKKTSNGWTEVHSTKSSHKNIEQQLKSLNITNYTINKDGTVDVHQDVIINEKIKKLPVKFGIIDGNFSCKLSSLEGAPKEVSGHFFCEAGGLTSLEGAPEKVGKHFYVSRNKLTSLEGAPKEIGEGFSCNENQLTSLEGAPEKVKGDFFCSFNNLTSLKGAPKEVGRHFYCVHNQLTSLKGAPEKVGRDFDCSHNQLTSLKGAPKEIGMNLMCEYNKLTYSDILDVIKNITVRRRVFYKKGNLIN